MTGAHVMFSPTYVITDASGRSWKFDCHNMFGPTVLTQQGEPRVRQPGATSAFWPAFEKWHATKEKV